jgi:hypothetical protein
MLFYFLKIDFQSLETGLQTIVKTQFFYKKIVSKLGLMRVLKHLTTLNFTI